MTPFMLVRHPGPFETESLTGYMLRLSEVNGYMTPWSICQLAGLRQSEIRTTGIPIAKLAAITNRRVSELERIAFTPPPGKPRWASLLSHPMLPTELNVTNPMFCPQCVSERGFIEAHWHLRLMVACPVHLRPGVTRCHKCLRPIRWFRPGLLECQCGESLQFESETILSARDVSLLAVIRRRVISDSTADANPARLPVADLAFMDLRSLIALTRTLAKFRLIADGLKPIEDPFQIVFTAGRVLSDWPTNFFALLSDIGSRANAVGHGAVGKQFDGIYRSLMRNKAINKGQTDFIRNTFMEFATDHWGRGFVDRKLAQRVVRTSQPRYVSLAEFSARIGVQPRTAKRILKDRRASAERVTCGKTFRTIVDSRSEFIPAKAPGRVLRVRAAARTLGLPVSTLQELRACGVFEVRHLPPGHPGWHEEDIEQFRAEFPKDMVPNAPVPRNTPDQVTLSRVMNNRHLSPKVKAACIAGLLAESIAVNGSVDGTIAGIQLDPDDYERFLSDMRKLTWGESCTPTEVAALLHCDRATISGLFDRGFLRGRRTPVGLRIDKESVERFASEYESLASRAKTCETSARALLHKCREARVGLLLVSVKNRKAPQPFARRCDLNGVLATAA
jgi:hypothetical protein